MQPTAPPANARTHTYATAVAHALLQHQWQLASAESCTGGMVAAACTDLAGSSIWFERGFVTYSNAAKTELLGVDARLIDQHGAVSEAVVRAMAQGALAHSHAHVALAISGVAGPSGGCTHNPVGSVWFAWALPHALHSEKQHFVGDRAAVRAAASAHALKQLCVLLDSVATPSTRP